MNTYYVLGTHNSALKGVMLEMRTAKLRELSSSARFLFRVSAINCFHPSPSWAFCLRTAQFLCCPKAFHGSLWPWMTKPFSLVFKVLCEVSLPGSLPGPIFLFLPLTFSPSFIHQVQDILGVLQSLQRSWGVCSWAHMGCCLGLAGPSLPPSPRG